MRCGDPALQIATVAHELKVHTIYGQRAKTSEEIRRLNAIEQKTPQCRHHWVWNDYLFDPEELPFDAINFPRGFTKFRKIVERGGRPNAPLSPLIGCSNRRVSREVYPCFLIMAWLRARYIAQVQSRLWSPANPAARSRFSAMFGRVGTSSIIKNAERNDGLVAE